MRYILTADIYIFIILRGESEVRGDKNGNDKSFVAHQRGWLTFHDTLQSEKLFTDSLKGNNISRGALTYSRDELCHPFFHSHSRRRRQLEHRKKNISFPAFLCFPNPLSSGSRPLYSTYLRGERVGLLEP